MLKPTLALASLVSFASMFEACERPPAQTDTDSAAPPTDTETDTDTDTETASSTGETGTPPTDTAPDVDPDCLVPAPPGPFPYTTGAILTEEDFDFDQLGFLNTQANQDLRGTNRLNQSHIIAPNIGVDAAGIRSLSTGDVVIAQPDTGTLRLVNYATGGSIVMLGGLSFPNGLEATTDGYIFSSEYVANGRIRLIEPYSEAVTIVAQIDYPNNMALAPDDNTLYIAASESQFGGSGRVMALDRDASGYWNPEPRIVLEDDQVIGGIAADKCGNVYAVEYSGGKVFRLPVDGGTPELLVDLPAGSFYSSLRFGNGVTDFGRTELFVTNRSQLFVIDVGIEGHHVLAQ